MKRAYIKQYADEPNANSTVVAGHVFQPSRINIVRIKWLLFFAFIIVASGLYAGQNKKLTIKKTLSPIAIDGFANDQVWQSILETPINMYECSDNPGMSGSFKMTYDDKNFYLLCSVIDSTPLNINPLHAMHSDRIWVYFSMDTASNLGRNIQGALGALYKPGFWSFYNLIAPDSIKFFNGYDLSKPHGYGGSLNGDANYNITAFFENENFKYSDQADGYYYNQEWQIPRDSLDPLQSFNGSCFKFDIKVYNSKDTAAPVFCPISWSTPELNANLNYYFGLVYLSEENISEQNGFSDLPVADILENHITILSDKIQLAHPSAVTIFGIDGKLVLKNAKTTFVNTSLLKGGVYIVKAGTETRKFLK